LEDFPITFMFLPQEDIKSIFGCKHDSLVRPITHHSRRSSCPETTEAFFRDDCASTVHRTLILQKLRAQTSLLLQSDLDHLHQVIPNSVIKKNVDNSIQLHKAQQYPTMYPHHQKYTFLVSSHFDYNHKLFKHKTNHV